MLNLDEIDYITYEELQNLPDKPDRKFNRMFTCCERKIFAKLRKNKPANKYVYIILHRLLVNIAPGNHIIIKIIKY